MIYILLYLLLINTLIFTVSINYLGLNNFQMASVISQVVSLIIIFFAIKFFKIKNSVTIKSVSTEFPIYIVLIIVIGNALIGIINLDYLLELIDFTELNEASGMNIEKFSMFTGSASIIISQAGGFVIQIFLTYFLSEILDIEIRFKEVFSLLGTAYLGFLIISIIIFAYNVFFLEHFSSFSEFKDVTKNSTLYLIMGKSGEYITLCLAAFFFWKYKNISPQKSILVVYLPNVLLMLSYLIFNKIL